MNQRQLWIVTASLTLGVLAVGLAAILGTTQPDIPLAAPILAFVGLLGFAGIVVALRYPDVAVVMLIAADAAKLSDITADLIGIGVFQPLLALAVISLSLALLSGRLRLQWSLFHLTGIALTAVIAASVLVAGGSEAGMEAFFDFGKDLTYLGVVLVWASTQRSWKLATGVLVGVMALLGALSVIQEFVFGNSTDFLGFSKVHVTQLGAVTLRHSGPEMDANFWARSLALTLPLALSWWAASRRALARWAAGAAALAIGLGLYLTQSRGGLVAVSMAVVLWLVLAGRRYVRLLKFAPIVAAVLLIVPGVGSRLITLTEIDDAQQGAGDPSLQGRVGAQEAGIGMFFAEPILGVGFGEFRLTVPEVQRDLGIRAEVLDAHNLIIEIAAESGLIGLAAWALFLGFGVFAALRVLLLSRQRDPGDDDWNRLMAAGIVSGMMAWLAASIFLHAASLRVLFTILAIGVGMDAGLRGSTIGLKRHIDDVEAVRTVEDGPLAVATYRRVFVRAAKIGAPVFLIVGALGLWIFGPTPGKWVAERHVVVTTGEEAFGPYLAYSQDLISRGLIGPTYAAVLEDPEFTERATTDLGWDPQTVSSTEVSATYLPTLQLISIRVEGDSETQVSTLAAAVVTEGTRFIDGLSQPYVVEDVGSARTETQTTGPSGGWRVALAIAAGAAAAIAAAIGAAWIATFNRLRGVSREARESRLARLIG
jgi:O-antigen ligase